MANLTRPGSKILTLVVSGNILAARVGYSLLWIRIFFLNKLIFSIFMLSGQKKIFRLGQKISGSHSQVSPLFTSGQKYAPVGSGKVMAHLKWLGILLLFCGKISGGMCRGLTQDPHVSTLMTTLANFPITIFILVSILSAS